jgi:hypothetical protein
MSSIKALSGRNKDLKESLSGSQLRVTFIWEQTSCFFFFIAIHILTVNICSNHLTITNSSFFPHSPFPFFLGFPQQRSIIFLNNIHWLVFVLKKEFVCVSINYSTNALYSFSSQYHFFQKGKRAVLKPFKKAKLFRLSHFLKLQPDKCKNHCSQGKPKCSDSRLQFEQLRADRRCICIFTLAFRRRLT